MLVLVMIAAILRQLLLWTSTVVAVAAAAAAGDSDNVAMLVVAGALAFPERQKLCLDFSHSYLSARNLLPAWPVPLSGQKI